MVRFCGVGGWFGGRVGVAGRRGDVLREALLRLSNPDGGCSSSHRNRAKKKGRPHGRPFFFALVEAGGIEPPSASNPPVDLHV